MSMTPTDAASKLRAAAGEAAVAVIELALEFAAHSGWTPSSRADTEKAQIEVVVRLLAENARYRKALERVMAETGTSSLAHHAARQALDGEGEA